MTLSTVSSRAGRVAKYTAAPALAVASTPVFAQSSLPSTGVTVGTYVTDLVSELGTIAGSAIAAGFALYLLFRGVMWVKRLVK